MEQDFQTSFIPKKPMVDDRAVAPRPISLLTIVSIFILFTVLLVTVGLYFYKGIVAKNITQMQTSLETAQNRFEPAKIAQLQSLDKRLRASTEVLNQHIAISPIFQALQAITMKSVQYTKFSYTLGTDKNPSVAIQMSGIAVGYRSIALQADLFTQNKDLIDPVFSNLTLDNNGNVLFDLNFSVDPSFVNYKQVLKTENGQATPSGASTN